MLICPAKSFDIPAIMAVEHNAFIPAVQEKQKIFEQRLRVFPEGFFVLQDTSDETVLRHGHALTAGYFCSERWGSVPDTDAAFTIGHTPKKTHRADGSVLYVSSFALLATYRGRGEGKRFFQESVRAVLGAFTEIRTVVLLVSADWALARHIYTSCGFREVRTLPDFFPSLSDRGHADGIILTCPAAGLHG